MRDDPCLMGKTYDTLAINIREQRAKRNEHEIEISILWVSVSRYPNCRVDGKTYRNSLVGTDDSADRVCEEHYKWT